MPDRHRLAEPKTPRYPSFGADVGRDAQGRFVRLDPPARLPLHVRLARAKALQRPDERRGTSWFAGIFRRVEERLFFLPFMHGLLDEHDRRVSDLLAANNREVERRREVQQAAAALREEFREAQDWYREHEQAIRAAGIPSAPDLMVPF